VQKEALQEVQQVSPARHAKSDRSLSPTSRVFILVEVAGANVNAQVWC
jgi:hypothetical protein